MYSNGIRQIITFFINGGPQCRNTSPKQDKRIHRETRNVRSNTWRHIMAIVGDSDRKRRYTWQWADGNRMRAGYGRREEIRLCCGRMLQA